MLYGNYIWNDFQSIIMKFKKCYAGQWYLQRRPLRNIAFKSYHKLYASVKMHRKCGQIINLKPLLPMNNDRKFNNWPVGVTMTARSIVDHCAHPWDLANDMGTNESAHREIISQSGIPNGELMAATQPSSICYATCYAMSLMNAF